MIKIFRTSLRDNFVDIYKEGERGAKMGDEGEIQERGSEEKEKGGKGKEVVVMDTPDRSKRIATPISKFEV